MKTKKLLLIVSLTLLTGWVTAQNYPSGSLLWKVSGNGLEKPSYLFGTFHLKTGDFLNKVPGAHKALNDCEQVIGEIKMGNMQELQMEMMAHMMLPADTTYRMLYSDEEYIFLNNKLTEVMSVGLDQLGTLKPAALQTAIIAIIFQQLLPDFNPANSLDLEIQKFAARDQKGVQGLEKPEEQAQLLFNSQSISRQAELLLCSLRNLDDITKNDAVKMIENYVKGDLNGLYLNGLKKEDDPCPSTEEEKNRMLKYRNDKWMQQLPAMMKEKSSFIAVGALHLAGEEGLLHQLKEAGYTVDPITN